MKATFQYWWKFLEKIIFHNFTLVILNTKIELIKNLLSFSEDLKTMKNINKLSISQDFIFISFIKKN